MASGMLMGAGIGAATSLATGNDPLKGAAMGGASGGLGGTAMSSAPAYTGATSMMQAPTIMNAGAGSMMGGLGNVASNAMDGFTDMTGMTGQDLGGMAFNKGVNALSQPHEQQHQLNVPQASISRPQFQPGMQGGGLVNSNPLMRKRQGLL